MKDSNQFHAICQDTYPPISYMNDMSRIIVRLCHVINKHYGSVKAAYTFDAGPNAVIYCLEQVLNVERTFLYFSPALSFFIVYRCSDVTGILFLTDLAMFLISLPPSSQ